jgi:F0F1-type ATP synthase assembly protein I
MPDMTDKKPLPFSLGKLRLKSLTLASACVAVSLIICGGGGYLLDLILDKKPFFVIIGLALGLIVTDVLVVVIGKKIHLKK